MAPRRKPEKINFSSATNFYAWLREYENSETWKHRKARYFKKNKRECVICGTIFKIHLHHLSYAASKIKAGSEPDRDLMPLCYNHHTKIHAYNKASKLTGPDRLRINSINYARKESVKPPDW